MIYMFFLYSNTIMDRRQKNNYSPHTHEKTSPEKKNEKLLSNFGYGKILVKSESSIMNDKVVDELASNKPAVLTDQDINNYILNCVSNMKVSDQKSPTHSKLFPFKSMDLSNSINRSQSNSSIDNMNGFNNLHSSIDQGKYPRNNMTLKPSLSSPPPYCASMGSRDSPSPRASIGSIGHEMLKSSPLYENVDFYGGGRSLTQTPTYYHQRPRPGSHSSGGSQDSRHSSPRTSIVSCEGSSALYESNYRKAQPQVPVSYPKYMPPMGKEVPPYEAPPVYETLPDTNKNSNMYEPAKPGPQVPTQSVDHVGRYAAQHATPYIKPIPTVPHATKVMPEFSSQTNFYSAKVNNSPNHMSYSQGTASPKPTTISSQMCVVGQPSLAESRSQKQPNSMAKVFQTASSYQQESPTHHNTSVRTSPTPPLPIKAKQPAKNLLPYNVTPPRPMVNLFSLLFILMNQTVHNLY